MRVRMRKNKLDKNKFKEILTILTATNLVTK